MFVRVNQQNFSFFDRNKKRQLQLRCSSLCDAQGEAQDGPGVENSDV